MPPPYLDHHHPWQAPITKKIAPHISTKPSIPVKLNSHSGVDLALAVLHSELQCATCPGPHCSSSSQPSILCLHIQNHGITTTRKMGCNSYYHDDLQWCHLPHELQSLSMNIPADFYCKHNWEQSTDCHAWATAGPRGKHRCVIPRFITSNT